MPDENDQRLKHFSSTSLFSIISACLSHGKTKLQTLEVVSYGLRRKCDGVSVDSLFMHRQLLDCFSDLRTLELLLTTRGGSYRGFSLEC